MAKNRVYMCDILGLKTALKKEMANPTANTTHGGRYIWIKGFECDISKNGANDFVFSFNDPINSEWIYEVYAKNYADLIEKLKGIIYLDGYPSILSQAEAYTKHIKRF